MAVRARARACVPLLVSRCEIRRRRRHPHEHVAATYFSGVLAAAVVSRRTHVRVVRGQIPAKATYGAENGDPGVNRLLQEGILCAVS